MNTDEVIAIAKTLTQARVSLHYKESYPAPYRIEFDDTEFDNEAADIYYGNSWEEALRDAGWKG